jgi:hypothetical protein
VILASFCFYFMIPVLLDSLTIFFVVAGVVLLWLNLRVWPRNWVVITHENDDRSEHRKDRVAQPPREAESLMAWSTRFEDPIDLPDGRKLITLRDAASYITELPNVEQQAEEWQTAARRLIDTAEGRNLMMHAQSFLCSQCNNSFVPLREQQF